MVEELDRRRKRREIRIWRRPEGGICVGARNAKRQRDRRTNQDSMGAWSPTVSCEAEKGFESRARKTWLPGRILTPPPSRTSCRPARLRPPNARRSSSRPTRRGRRLDALQRVLPARLQFCFWRPAGGGRLAAGARLKLASLGAVGVQPAGLREERASR